MAVQIAHAAFEANWLEGRWARGPSIRSDRTVSMMACWRWVMSACAVASVLLVRNGWWRHYAQALVMTGMPVDRGLVCGFGRVWAA